MLSPTPNSDLDCMYLLCVSSDVLVFMESRKCINQTNPHPNHLQFVLGISPSILKVFVSHVEESISALVGSYGRNWKRLVKPVFLDIPSVKR
jgi:hypothetical protein